MMHKLATSTFLAALAATTSVAGDTLENQVIGLRTAGTVFVIVFTGVIWLTRKLQKFDDRLAEGDKRFDRIELTAKQNYDNLTKQIDALPCPNCGDERKTRHGSHR